MISQLKVRLNSTLPIHCVEERVVKLGIDTWFGESFKSTRVTIDFTIATSHIWGDENITFRREYVVVDAVKGHSTNISV